MARFFTLDDLQKQFEHARDRLTRDQQDIVAAFSLPEDFNRDQYGFLYMRAERVGLDVIGHRIKQVSWLPVQLDPQPEIRLNGKTALANWLRSEITEQPRAAMFGNDFIHALTRAALMHGWNSPEFRDIALRVGEIFHDLSCLIALVYYGVWMAENGVGAVSITESENLELIARELEIITRSPEVALLLQQRRMEVKEQEEIKRKTRPFLHIVENIDGNVEPHSTA
ncbi:MAG: hypothetical protein P4M13_09145 [Alphaproteobacteria bacterium]|nr:hypothetical protein [Alphaproteobacteria bacterium]